MKEKIRVLVSNLPLPYHGIGSWTEEFNYFLKKNKFFDYVLSPSKDQDEVFAFSAKRKWFRGSSFFRDSALKNWVVKDYSDKLLNLSEKNTPLQILVLDDQVLLEGICKLKDRLPKGTEVIFYYHGHALSLKSVYSSLVDKVFFLTEAGYKESLRINNEFTPEVEIIGNGVSSDLFFPLTSQQKTLIRQELGFASEDKIICWMANSRPVKGIHLFGKMIPRLLDLDPKVKIITIGHNSNPDWEHNRVSQLGRLKPKELSRYLQISDYYFFTSLWKEGFGLSLVEAIKCGNFIFTSANGGIKDVVRGYPFVKLIDTPNIIDSWISEFQNQLLSFPMENKEEEMSQFLKDFHSLESWEFRLKKGLE
ncbi:glycosyltransferase family 4 protein [Algoriphagus sp.]|uniref:glycosyltransferase family 4 protein n=1 Tax=Algoriphagus sp. TaxID=1872435 RepID=UPI0025F8C1B4|nr:glycosyltransferase family 4 protein [Algoriphagus sp.]